MCVNIRFYILHNNISIFPFHISTELDLISRGIAKMHAFFNVHLVSVPVQLNAELPEFPFIEGK